MFGAPPAGPAARPRPPERLVRSERLDRLSPFLAGPHYGPVLTPMLLKAVNASLQVNPLLLPVGESDRVHLKWNMLFSTAHCQRSTDPSHRSWSNGRSEPATFPRVSSLRLVSRTVPWIIDISAANPAVGVTCGDVVEQLSEYLQRRLRKEDYETAREDRRRLIRQAYHHNRSRSEGVPGGQLGDGLKRLDWLGTQTMWGGLERNDSFIMERYGVSLPCTLELVCYDRPMMSEQQIEEERRARRRSTASRRPSRPQSRAQSRPPSRSDGSNSS
ncbi:hypothetical protein BV25DRAFT_1804565 [Artomyces pyxidatus]|uniref:Uncharacterized protein n=1 Tax=Artomyces pyxidatus TaxID=48021 RepID=A0ACB8T077_9AGAM|nr:hypothetical protein BV25DRAFT_1804565 [Artomyces pyxidatus]